MKKSQQQFWDLHNLRRNGRSPEDLKWTSSLPGARSCEVPWGWNTADAGGARKRDLILHNDPLYLRRPAVYARSSSNWLWADIKTHSISGFNQFPRERKRSKSLTQVMASQSGAKAYLHHKVGLRYRDDGHVCHAPFSPVFEDASTQSILAGCFIPSSPCLRFHDNTKAMDATFKGLTPDLGSILFIICGNSGHTNLRTGGISRVISLVLRQVLTVCTSINRNMGCLWSHLYVIKAKFAS